MQVQNPQEIQKYYQALLDRDQGFVGIFYVGVKTTGIFCIATCRARKPKLENVTFYTDLKETLRDGFRPCKVCKPTENAHEPIPEVVQAMQLAKSHPKQKVTDQDLRDNGLQPEKIRRWLKQHYGVTFQAYQRMVRINLAFQELQQGKSVTDSAFDSGYDSLSGFGYTFKKMTGKSPNESGDAAIILITRLTTPIGPMFACATAKGICLLEFTDRKMLETEFEDLQKRLHAKIITGENEHLQQLKVELQAYFEGTRKRFDVALDTPGSEMQRSAWNKLLDIPYGTTISYQMQAERIGRPSAVRAAASANGQNRVAIVVPCHRVIGKNGDLCGYSGGLERKQWLLDHEQRHLGS